MVDTGQRPKKLAGGVLRRHRLGDEVTRRIREDLISGTYSAGSRLGVQTLADELGVSTMPVREALVALWNEGMVEALPGRGFRALQPRPIDIEDVFTIHAFIAGLLAERAAEKITDEVLTELRYLHGEIGRTVEAGLSEAETARIIEELNFSFHRTINASVDAPRLKWFLRATTRFVPRDYYRTVPGWAETTLHDHDAIIDRIAARDGAAARRLMEEHVIRGGRLAALHSTNGE
jgi:DNA-binding GntR family transcriptional regulator